MSFIQNPESGIQYPAALSLVGLRRSFARLRQISVEELEEYKREFGERWKGLGWFIQEEDYLVGEYPIELASPAREYLDKERPEIRKKISDEASQRWFTPKTYF